MLNATINKLEKGDYAGEESLNTICSNLLFIGNENKKLLITSCSAHEGKSYMSMHILRNLVSRGMRVALVDADLRRSTILSSFDVDLEGMDLGMGLAHYLSGLCDVYDAVYEVSNLPGAYFVPIGSTVQNPIPLLSSERFQDLLDELSRVCDLVLIDTPPIGAVIDAAIMARVCDGAIFVVNYNRTRGRELLAAKNQIQRSGCKALGCVINQISFDTISSKKYYNKSYYNHYSKGYYGKSVRK